MSTMTLPSPTLRATPVAQIFRNAFRGSRNLTINAMVMLICFGVCFVLQYVDARELNGANVWVKPGKFFFSMTLHLLTTAWALSFVEPQDRTTRIMRWSIWATLISAWGELVYIAYRAGLGEASHFNVSTPLTSALYTTMAVGAVVLVIAPAVIGWKIWRLKRGDLWAEAIGLGFGVGAVLTIIVGMTLGSNTSHWIGGDLTDATGVGLFKWSTTGGDLRVSHFIALHAMQVVPFAALSGKRAVVYGAAAVIVVLSTATYFQALAGIPLFRG